MNIPNHVAIILDGNGRWAKAKGMPRNYGHVQGAKTVEEICEVAYKMGIQYLTVYAFSTENWNRPKDEVDALMKLLRNYMKNCLKTASKNNMCVRVIGEKSRLDNDIRESIAQLEEATKNNTGLHFSIAINYGGRDEIIRGIKKIIKCGYSENEITEEHKINVENVEDELFVSLNHPKQKKHFISWIAVVRFDSVEIIKLYPEQNAECRIKFGRMIKIYAYCNKHGLYEIKL